MDTRPAEPAPLPPPPDPVAKNETSSQTYCLCFLLLPSDLKCERNVAYELSGCSGIKSDLLKRKAEVEEKLKKPLGSHCVITMFHNADSTYLSPFEPMAFSDSLWYLRLREKIHADAQMALEQKSAAAHPKVPEQKISGYSVAGKPCAPHLCFCSCRLAKCCILVGMRVHNVVFCLLFSLLEASQVMTHFRMNLRQLSFRTVYHQHRLRPRLQRNVVRLTRVLVS